MMNYIKLVIFFLLFSNKALSQDTLIQQANDLYLDQNYIRAALLYDSIYTIDTLNNGWAIKCANSLYLAGNTKQAKNYLNRLIESSLDTFSCYKVYAKLYEADDNIPMAIKAYRYLIQKDSLNLGYRKNLGRIYMSNRLFTDARKEYEYILSNNGEDVSAAIHLAEVYIHLKDNSLAGKIIDQVISKDSTNINARKVRARLFYDIKAYHEVVEDLNYVNKVTDMTEYYYNMLGVSNMYIDSFDSAELFLTKSFSVKEYKEYGYYYIATMAEKNGDFEKAKTYYNMAIDEGISDFTDIYYKRMAEMFLEQNKYDEAIFAYEKANSLKEKPEYIYFLGVSHDYKEDAVKAITFYKKYIDMTTTIEGRYLTKANERIAYLESYLSQKKVP